MEPLGLAVHFSQQDWQHCTSMAKRLLYKVSGNRNLIILTFALMDKNRITKAFLDMYGASNSLD